MVLCSPIKLHWIYSANWHYFLQLNSIEFIRVIGTLFSNWTPLNLSWELVLCSPIELRWIYSGNWYSVLQLNSIEFILWLCALFSNWTPLNLSCELALCSAIELNWIYSGIGTLFSFWKIDLLASNRVSPFLIIAAYSINNNINCQNIKNHVIKYIELNYLKSQHYCIIYSLPFN